MFSKGSRGKYECWWVTVVAMPKVVDGHGSRSDALVA